MPQDSLHPEYASHRKKWKKCRDCFAGEEAVKAAKDDYLPKLNGSDQAEYEAYVKRASFYSASRRTVQAMTGLVMKQDAELVSPEAPNKSYGVDNLGLNGEPVLLLAKKTLGEVIAMGRVGLLVDLEDAVAPRPYVALYITESIINWATEVNNGREILSMVMLHEPTFSPKAEDPYEWEATDFYRELFLQNGVYNVRRWKKIKVTKDNKEQIGFEQVGPVTIPKRQGGKSFDFIPFAFCSVMGLAPEVEDSPILDLVNVNLSHYRNGADLEHGLHYTALPTAWVSGFDIKTTKLKIGSSDAWVSDNENAKCGYLEFTGAGLSAIEKQLDRKEAQMAILGARMLENPKRGVESADAIGLRTAGEHGVLAGCALSVSAAWTNVLNWVGMYAGEMAPDYKLVLSTDFNPAVLDPTMFTALSGAVQAGNMSWEAFFYNCQQYGLYPDGTSMEDEQELIAAGNESRAAAAQPPQIPDEGQFNKGTDIGKTGGDAAGSVAQGPVRAGAGADGTDIIVNDTLDPKPPAPRTA